MQKHNSVEKENAIINGQIKVLKLHQGFIKDSYNGKERKRRIKKNKRIIKSLQQQLK